MVTLVGDGHTTLWPSPPGGRHHRLPLMFYRFADGLFVRAADAAYAGLVGARVVAIGGRTAEQLFGAAGRYLAHDNEWQLYEEAPNAFADVALLRLFGATADGARVAIVLERGGARSDVTVTAVSPAEVERMLVPVLEQIPRFDQRVEAPGWVSLRRGEAGDAPLWLRHPYRAYWLTYLEAHGVLYLQYNDAREEDDQSFDAFVAAVFEAVAKHRPRALVIDLRFNSGGRTFLSQPLVKRLAGDPTLDRRGALFTIVGRRTSSSGMRFAANLDFWTETLFVGEPTGQPPNVHGGTNRFQLPHLGTEFRVASRFWVGGRTTDDTRPFIAPDLAAEMTAADYAAGRDPALDAILAYLER